MPRQKNRKRDQEDPEASADAPETAEESTDRLQALEAEVESLREKWLRAQADYQNLRRRGQSDYEAGLKQTLTPLLDELLLVLDFLELALASPTTTPEAKNLATGVEMTRVKLLQALESVEVYPITTEGIFDPKLHDASESRLDPGAAPGTILETKRRGYTWKELVLRPAQVVVATGGDDESAEEK